MLLCEASRAPSCNNVIVNDDDIAKGECARAYGLGSQCRPNECIFGSGNPRGFGISGGRVQSAQMKLSGSKIEISFFPFVLSPCGFVV